MEKIEITDWTKVRESLNRCGFAQVKGVLTPDVCVGLTHLYSDEKLFRSTINMERYRFGRGAYKYFSYPLPHLIQLLREDFYKPLVPIANDWMQQLGIDVAYPEELSEFLSICHSKNQHRPTPLMLRYEAGGYNTLHQDIYGDVYFPFQVVFMLSEAGKDYSGGELVFVEQLPRAQSRAEVVCPGLGDAVIFTTNFRPVKGSRGYYRARMKHGVSKVKEGMRQTMGLIFHDAS